MKKLQRQPDFLKTPGFALLERRLTELLDKSARAVIIGVDGGSGSGKSTLADCLAARFDGNLFRADDFFLRGEQRTPERLAEPGGNMDRERLEAEVLRPLRERGSAVYRPFSCSRMELLPPVSPPARRLNIVEGSYSLHPTLRGYYDLTVFLDTPRQVRLERLRRRERDAEKFIARWLPPEDRYFELMDIKAAADIVL